MALADSRQFSGLVTLATRPLLRTRKIGAPPRTRTAHTEFATRPLTTCCCGAWRPRGDSNTQWRVWNPHASPSATGTFGRLGRIRTDTGHGLSVLPLPSWATSLSCIKLGVRGEIRTRNNAALDRMRLPVAPPERWWAVKDSNLGDPKGIPRLQRGAFGQLSQLPKHELSKIWRKAGDSNAYVPRDLA